MERGEKKYLSCKLENDQELVRQLCSILRHLITRGKCEGSPEFYEADPDESSITCAHEDWLQIDEIAQAVSGDTHMSVTGIAVKREH